MGRRYFCDYCEKSFVETPEAVKKHRNGLTHQNLMKGHYAQFKEKRLLLAEESVKNPCNRFMTAGHCPFGSSCRYSHFSRGQIDQLRWEVEQSETSFVCPHDGGRPNLQTWFTSRRKRSLQDSEPLKKVFSETVEPADLKVYEMTSFQYPQALEGAQGLPPSAKKLRVEDFLVANKEEWG